MFPNDKMPKRVDFVKNRLTIYAAKLTKKLPPKLYVKLPNVFG